MNRYKVIAGIGLILLSGCLKVSVKCDSGQVSEFTCTDPQGGANANMNACANSLAVARAACNDPTKSWSQ